MSISPSTFVTFIRRTPEFVVSNVINIWYFFLLYVSVLVFRLYRSAVYSGRPQLLQSIAWKYTWKCKTIYIRRWTEPLLWLCRHSTQHSYSRQTTLRSGMKKWKANQRKSEKTRKRERKTSLRWDNVDFSGAHVYFCYSVPTNRLEHAQFDSSFMCILCNFLVLTVSNDSE